MHIINIDPGRTVLCDLCNEDYTDNSMSGGGIYKSYALCPECFDETRFKRAARCPAYLSFSDFVRTYRQSKKNLPVEANDAR